MFCAYKVVRGEMERPDFLFVLFVCSFLVARVNENVRFTLKVKKDPFVHQVSSLVQLPTSHQRVNVWERLCI